jgi:peptidoglycan/xylan/chitin deacetylase (PgdA/CDA1 family)
VKKIDPRNTLTHLSSFLNLEKSIQNSSIKIIFPFYHAVNDNPGAHLKHLYPIKSRNEFTEDLDKLLQYYEPLSPDFLINGIPKYDRPGFILSFDDGLREVKEVIAPLLLSKGIPSIFFLNNNFIDNKGLFFRYKVSILVDRIIKKGLRNSEFKEIQLFFGKNFFKTNAGLIKKLYSLDFKSRHLPDKIARILDLSFEDYLGHYKPYLEHEEILDLKKKGFYLGAHSREHPEFYNLDGESQEDEIKESLLDIKHRFHLEYSFFAFPFTDYGVDSRVFESLYNSPEKILDASFGTSGFKTPGKFPHYQRLSMEKYSGNSEKIIKTEYLYHRLKKFAGRT